MATGAVHAPPCRTACCSPTAASLCAPYADWLAKLNRLPELGHLLLICALPLEESTAAHAWACPMFCVRVAQASCKPAMRSAGSPASAKVMSKARFVCCTLHRPDRSQSGAHDEHMTDAFNIVPQAPAVHRALVSAQVLTSCVPRPHLPHNRSFDRTCAHEQQQQQQLSKATARPTRCPCSFVE